MTEKKNIFVIVGSAGKDSANLSLVKTLVTLAGDEFAWTIFNELRSLPHFEPSLSLDTPPELILTFRNAIQQADGIIICTPEYVFSIPSGLKNAIEWCVATTVFSEKPTGIITASANGLKGHEELQLIMKTVMAKLTRKTTLLIQGIKGKFDSENNLTDKETIGHLKDFLEAFKSVMDY